MLADRTPVDWKREYQSHLSTARISILQQIVAALSDDVIASIKSSSRIVVSNTDIATALVNWYRSQHGEYTPTPDFVIARDLTETTVLPEGLGGLVPLRLLEELNAREGRFSHVVLYLDEPLGEWDVVEVLKQARRALGAGGTLIVFSSNVDGVTSVLQAVGLNPGRQVSPFRIAGLQRLLVESKFESGNVQSAFSKTHVSRDGEVAKLAERLSASLEGALPACAEGEGWKLEFKEALERETRKNEGLVYGADIIVVKK